MSVIARSQDIADAWFTIGAAARLVGCSPSWIRRLEGEGRLPLPQRAGHRRVYSAGDIERIRGVIKPTGRSPFATWGKTDGPADEKVYEA